jgi:hypothetical protein
MNVTRRVVPETRATPDAVPDTVGPPPADAGATVTVTSPGAIVPAGKFEPVTATVVTPGCAAAGDAVDVSVTLDWARIEIEPLSASSKKKRTPLRGTICKLVTSPNEKPT